MNMIEVTGVSAGMGALNLAKNLRRINEARVWSKGQTKANKIMTKGMHDPNFNVAGRSEKFIAKEMKKKALNIPVKQANKWLALHKGSQKLADRAEKKDKKFMST